MTRQLLLVHGRAQQGKDAAELKSLWIESLERGLAKSNLTLPIAESDIRFPYYGDTLDDLVNDVPPDQAADIIIRGEQADEFEQAFLRSVLDEIQQARGITQDQVEEMLEREVIERGPLQWEWLQGIVRALDRHVPGASGAAVALATYDVHQYLSNAGIRMLIDQGVEQAVDPQRETVVVGHSLGSVVTYNVLRNAGDSQRWRIPLFVTVGSPLGVTAIRRGLRALKRIAHPKCAADWFNARDAQDIVALYELKAPYFEVNPTVSNTSHVDNPTDNQHGITGYLDDAQVARRIYDALVASP